MKLCFLVLLIVSSKTYSQVQGYPNATLKHFVTTRKQLVFLDTTKIRWVPDSITKKYENCVTPIPWDSTIYYTICGLGRRCTTSCRDYRLLSERNKKKENYVLGYGDEKDGIPIYGPEGAFVGVLNKYGFQITCRRDHLTGKPIDYALLENEGELIKYLKIRKIIL